MAKEFICWKCSNKLTNVILPMSRREECPDCAADQHVCKMCDFYDSKSYVGCNEERAESVSDSERANFCDYFTPSNKVFKARDRMKSAEAKAKFAALFGDEPVDNIAYTHTAPDAQETPDQHTSEPLTSKQLAEQKLRDLLGG